MGNFGPKLQNHPTLFGLRKTLQARKKKKPVIHFTLSLNISMMPMQPWNAGMLIPSMPIASSGVAANKGAISTSNTSSSLGRSALGSA